MTILDNRQVELLDISSQIPESGRAGDPGPDAHNGIGCGDFRMGWDIKSDPFYRESVERYSFVMIQLAKLDKRNKLDQGSIRSSPMFGYGFRTGA